VRQHDSPQATLGRLVAKRRGDRRSHTNKSRRRLVFFEHQSPRTQMSRFVLRLHSLALKEDGPRSMIHFDLEDETLVVQCRAVIEETDDGGIAIGAIDGYRGRIDGEAFQEIVERVYWEQVKMIGRLAAVVPVVSCIVALGEREIVIEEGRVAAGW
jgi:hypothetical protein